MIVCIFFRTYNRIHGGGWYDTRGKGGISGEVAYLVSEQSLVELKVEYKD
jgi:hypothetical protein